MTYCFHNKRHFESKHISHYNRNYFKFYEVFKDIASKSECTESDDKKNNKFLTGKDLGSCGII